MLISDPAQIKEPFKSFNHVVKDIRDATTHYSKQKANIWRGPAEWVKIANESCKICMECACSFWSACYPGRGLPIYLEELDSSKYIAIAKKRIKYEEIVN
ncbi:MAG TPA: hypothetical protein VLB04_03385 [Methanotrichaceae archaeon]|nr:hypothetical protein [Methanotrichaceae archaeon]